MAAFTIHASKDGESRRHIVVGFGNGFAEMGDSVAQRCQIVTIGQYDQLGKTQGQTRQNAGPGAGLGHDATTRRTSATEPGFKPSPADSFRKVLRNHPGMTGFNIWPRRLHRGLKEYFSGKIK
jgi:hypothetical protein